MRRILELSKKAIRFLLPKPSEFPLIILSLFLLFAVIVPEFLGLNTSNRGVGALSPWLEYYPMIILGISIAAALGTFPVRQLKHCRWFLMGLGCILLFNLFLLYRANMFFYPEELLHLQNRINRPWSPIMGWVGVVVGMLAGFIGTKFCFWMIRFAKQRFSFGEISRQKIMIAVAGVLFVCLTVRNILSQNNLSIGTGVFQGPVMQLIEAVVVVLLLVAFPAWLINRIRGWLGLLIAGVALGVIAGFSASFVSLPVQFLVAIYAIFFPIVVTALNSYLGLLEAKELIGSGPADVPVTKLGRSVSFWIWCFPLVVVSLGVAILFLNFSGRALVFGGQNRVELARQLKQVSTRRGLKARFDIWNGLGFPANNPVYVQLDLGFSEDAEPDCLSELVDPQNQFHFSFNQLNPKIETSNLRGLIKPGISISKSSITSQQLSDITSGVPFSFLSDFELVEPLVENSLKNIGRMSFTHVRPGETAKFLKLLDTSTFKGPFRIHEGELSDEDWEHILESSRLIDITIVDVPSDFAIDLAIANNVDRKLSVFADQKAKRFWDLVCKTKISIRMIMPNDEKSNQEFLDAVFASRGEDWASFMFAEAMGQPKNYGGIEQDVCGPDSRWVFQRNDSGSPTGLLLPDIGKFLKPATELKDLEILSLDVRWLESLQNAPNDNVPNAQVISSLGKLTKLKRLDMPIGFWGLDYSFLGEMPNLQHLQFDVYADGSKNVVFGFQAANCPELKSLVLIGQPSKAMAIEIGKLPKLETLKVLDVNQSLSGPGSVAQLQTTIGPDVKLTIIDAEDDRPNVPDAFAKHLARVRREICEKYLNESH